MREGDTILEAEQLQKYYPVKKGLILQREIGQVKAVDGLTFRLYRGETLGIIGESGCGKSTLARMAAGLEQPTGGTVRFLGQTVEGKMPPALRRRVQMVFQDPYSSLDPRMSVRRILEEPLRIHTQMSAEEKRRTVLPMLEQVGLQEEALKKYPHEFSGGQRQRIGIARALVLGPDLLICDEPVSALDVSIQAQILNLFKKLQRRYELTLLFVSHDMSVIRYISDRVLVMYLGQIMELADKKALFSAPAHPYTQALMRAVPVPDPSKTDQCAVLEGEIPSPIQAPPGCPFSTRCPRAMPACRTRRPALRRIAEGHDVACHLYEEAVQ